VTQWVKNPEGGRDRGPFAVARAWYEVVVNPRRFFRTGVAPGDQAPGLVFAMSVVLLAETTRLFLGGEVGYFAAVAGTDGLVTTLVLDLLWLGVAVAILTPVVLHLLAAVATVVLMVLVGDRAGVSETVQVIAYATAPCVLVGLPALPVVPVIAIRAAAGLYGMYLLLVGVETVHGCDRVRAALVAAVPAAVGFGYGFRTFASLGTLLRQWYII